jgi:hypothetical protein
MAVSTRRSGSRFAAKIRGITDLCAIICQGKSYSGRKTTVLTVNIGVKQGN